MTEAARVAPPRRRRPGLREARAGGRMKRRARTGCRRSSSSSSGSPSGSGCSPRSPASSCCRGPRAIAKAFWDNRHVLVNAGWFTFKEAFGGFVIGSGARDPRRARLRALPAGRLGADAVRDRGERRPDHRVRADHERLVRRAQPALEVGDRRRPLLLPRAREHAARPAVGAAGGDRADALLRGRGASTSSAASGSRRRCRSSSPGSRSRPSSR